MRVGFHTNAFVWAGLNDIVTIARFASEAGFDFLEVGPSIRLDQNTFKQAAEFVDLDSFIYCRNFIDDTVEAAERETAELYRRIDFAGSIGAKRIICSTGISGILSSLPSGGCNPLASLEKAADFVRKTLDKVTSYGMEVCIENCPMYRNIATSPLMWRKLFELIPDKNLGLCYDASHFVWQMIDVYKPFEHFSTRIKHIHLKDTSLDLKKLDDVGILHNTGSERGFEENQWWRHTIIGDGEIDWLRFLDLAASLPGGMPDLSFEMEDFHYEGTPENVRKGLELQLQRLRSLVVDSRVKARNICIQRETTENGGKE